MFLPIPTEGQPAFVSDLEADPFVGHAACELYHRYGMLLAPLTNAMSTANLKISILRKLAMAENTTEAMSEQKMERVTMETHKIYKRRKCCGEKGQTRMTA